LDLQNPKTILVVQIGKIGDMILTTPLFSELKRLFPESNLKVLSSEINKDIPLNHTAVDEVIVYRKQFFKNLSLLGSSLHKIDLWIDTKDGYSRTSEILLKVFRPKSSIGFNSGKTIFDINLKNFQKGKHAVDINLSPVNFFEKENQYKKKLKPSLNIPPEIKKQFDSVIPDDKRLKIMINISAGNQNRYLEKEKWLDIINKINSFLISSFTLIGLAKDNEIFEYLLKNFKGENINYIKTNNILETAELVRRNDIVITPDTSVVHLCSVFEKPVLALYPNVEWNLEKFSPLSKYNEVVISTEANSIKNISAEEVVNKFKKLIEQINSGNAESRTRVRKEDH
jgi:ADP-heptose:LPS heptosyltransferase